MLKIKEIPQSFKIGGLIALFAISMPLFFAIAETPNNSTPYPADLYAQCFDNKDNDGDGKTDLKDPDCPECNDGIDNDYDGLIDEDDPDCPEQEQKKTFKNAAAAFFGFSSTSEDANELREAETFRPAPRFARSGTLTSQTFLGTGYFRISADEIPLCGGRIVNFPRRVHTLDGGLYIVNTFYCDYEIRPGGRFGDNDENDNNRFRSAGHIEDSETISTPETLDSGEILDAGEEFDGGGTFKKSQTFSDAGRIKSGGTF